MRIKGIIFDLDGTIVETKYDWKEIRKKLGTEGKPILFYLQSLQEPEKSKKMRFLERYEEAATQKATLKDGVNELFDFLKARGIKKALVTNNSFKNVSYLLDKFNLEFDLVLSRESRLWKPTGLPFLKVMRKLGLSKEECCVVGDSNFDVQAARDAEIKRVFIISQEKEIFFPENVEVLPSLSALRKRIEDLIAC